MGIYCCLLLCVNAFVDADDGLKLFGENVRYEEISMEIEGVEGVIAHGLYAGVASAAIIVGDEGPIELSKGQPLTLSMEE